MRGNETRNTLLRVKKAKSRKYRYRNVSLIIGGSLAVFKKQFAGAVRPAKPPERPGRRPWLGRFFIQSLLASKTMTWR
jgi:hypothetical protein